MRIPALFAVCAVLGAAQTPGSLTTSERVHYHLKSTVGMGTVISTAAESGLDQWRNEPREWGHGAAGYGRRAGSYMAAGAVNNAIQLTAGALLHQDPRYFRSHQKGFWPRSWYAVERTFLAWKPGGGSEIAYTRLLGEYGSGFAANLWYPSRINRAGDALLRGTFALAGDAGNNAFREFWPDIAAWLKRRFR